MKSKFKTLHTISIIFLTIFLFIIVFYIYFFTKYDPIELISNFITSTYLFLNYLVIFIFIFFIIWLFYTALQGHFFLIESNIITKTLINKIMYLANQKNESMSSEKRLEIFKNIDPLGNTILGRAFQLITYVENNEIEMAVIHQFKPMNQVIENMRLISLLSTSLGFLGTAIGMIHIFNTYQNTPINFQSNLDFAKGIKLALITTILGLVLRIIALFWRGQLFKMKKIQEKNIHETILKALGLNILSRR